MRQLFIVLEQPHPECECLFGMHHNPQRCRNGKRCEMLDWVFASMVAGSRDGVGYLSWK
ncbi:hypothetical protein COCSUDRAFT_34342 [Coccomyxa subellipsoidea C-169]|uniref:Uncharacterized protein n=1 Tax=Coccomyxa subellipsoidea (strain C-169) TaxID=574566 RepID=I0YKW8_COCSC|nr:hypothetical protein COCSUDRAFT_34342 [Coccomyxa subellipsoidea C-169]EIE19037.1 hypothetical protein COCSUDRAFT_34342 [Coccomyxa subellipsoidea C-169]|eukprot:XP_005643581.1 hypothetical protein COCSUDRAFT_34342 [Coccomyxa subellipsoidea C-169]